MLRFSPLILTRILLAFTAYCFVVQPFLLFSFLQWFPSNNFFYLSIGFLGVLITLITWRHLRHMRPTFKSLLISFFPVAFMIGAGHFFGREFHYLVDFSVGLYVIALLAFLTLNFIRHQNEAEQIHTGPHEKILSPFSWKQPTHRLASGCVLILTLAFFGISLQNLTHFAAVDEPLWLDGRIGNFWKHFSLQHMDKTLISDKPGITIAITSGPGLWFVEPKNYRETRNDFEAKHPSADVEDLYLAFRLPLLIAITLLLPLFYLLLVPLIGTSAALFSYSAIVFSPILIGISKIVNPDSLLWVFAPLSFLAYLVFLEKRSWRFLFLSGILFGFALLTKYVANFLIVYFFALSFLYPLWRQDKNLNLSFLFKTFLAWLGTGLATLYCFVPAFWVKPGMILSSTIFSQAFEKVAWIFIVLMALVFIDQLLLKNRVSLFLVKTCKPYGTIFTKVILGSFGAACLFVFLNGIFGMPWIDFSAMLASPKTSEVNGLIAVFFSHFYPLIFGLAPLSLFGISILLWKTWRQSFSSSSALERLTSATALFILLYYLGSTVNGVVLINRYQIMLYPLMALLGGIGLSLLIETLLASLKQPRFTLAQPLSLSFFIGTSILLALSPLLTPFPLSYASSLLPKQYAVDIKDMGAGSYEAATYLNGLPQAKTTPIWTDKSGVCKFYIGPCIDGFTKRNLKEYGVQYVVLSSGRESRTQNRFTSEDPSFDIQNEHITRLDTYYKREDTLHTIKINGRSSQTVKIFSLNH